MYVLALSDYKQPAAAAGYKPAPQLTRPPIRQINSSLYVHKSKKQNINLQRQPKTYNFARRKCAFLIYGDKCYLFYPLILIN